MKSPELATLLRRANSLLAIRQIFTHKDLKPNEAHETFEQLRKLKKPDVDVYTSYLTYFAHKGELTAVTKGVEMAHRDGVASKDHWHNIFAQTFAAKANFTYAWESIQALRLRGKHLSPHEFSFCLVRLGTTKQALDAFSILWKEMRTDGTQPNAIIQSMFLAQYGSLGDMENALFWYKEMKKEGFKVSRVDYLTLIKWHVVRGEREGVKGWLKKAKLDGFMDVKLFSSIIGHAARTGNFADAWFWLQEMRKEKIRPNIITFNGIISELARQGEMLEAEKWVQEAQKEGLRFDHFTISSMAYGYASARKPRMVDFWMEMLGKSGIPPNAPTYSGVVAGFAKNKDMESAEKWHERMKKQGLKLTGIAQNLMAQGYAEKGEVEKCSRFVYEMIEDGVYVDDILTSLLNKTK
eukprot:Phypoly_transcript_08656.p1 GENE.Phypoly_transcript_08656~~Phypoly_transcript_08656.p1  ORF type:complete len:409 (+),score=87.58 Phypoly_transcript_08656:240-1466(+)